MDLRLSIYDFLRSTDVTLNEIDYIKASFALVFIHTIILYSYLFASGKLIRYFGKIKSDKDFFFVCMDSVSIAVIEQACFTVYLKLALTKIIGDRKLARFFTCLIFTGSHVANFNLVNEIPTIILQMITTFAMSLVYTKMDVLDAFILNIFCNVFSVLIKYAFWKILFKARLFQGKTFITPIIVESTGSSNLGSHHTGIEINTGLNTPISKMD